MSKKEKAQIKLITISTSTQNADILEWIKENLRHYNQIFFVRVSAKYDRCHINILTDEMIEEEILKNKKDIDYIAIQEVEQCNLYRTVKYMLGC